MNFWGVTNNHIIIRFNSILNSNIYTTLGHELPLLEAATGKSVHQISQISQASRLINILNYLAPRSPFRVGEILIKFYANADYQNILFFALNVISIISELNKEFPAI